jgi:hypothetical protein
MRTFAAGTKFTITFDDTLPNHGDKVYIRLLHQGASPSDDEEEVGTFDIKTNLVEFTLDHDYPNIVQVSAHGGPNPFGTHDLGPGNGAVRVKRVDTIP